jgi:hypothetical protein
MAINGTAYNYPAEYQWHTLLGVSVEESASSAAADIGGQNERFTNAEKGQHRWSRPIGYEIWHWQTLRGFSSPHVTSKMQ